MNVCIRGDDTFEECIDVKEEGLSGHNYSLKLSSYKELLGDSYRSRYLFKYDSYGL